MEIKFNKPSRELYQQVMGSFISSGTSLSAWCKENNLARSNVVAALTGSWNGPKGKLLRSQVVEASGLQETKNENA